MEVAENDTKGSNHMAQISNTAGMTTGDSTPRDDVLEKEMNAQVNEAAERVTFHRVELERWERVGRSGQAALRELGQRMPVAQQTPDGFLMDQPQQAPEPYRA